MENWTQEMEEAASKSRFKLGISPLIWDMTVHGLATLIRAYYSVNFENLEALPKEGAYILAPNHELVEDIPLAAAALKYATGRRCYSIMKEEITHWKTGKLWLSTGGIPIKRGGGDNNIASGEFAKQTLLAGNVLMVYFQARMYENIMGPVSSPAVLAWSDYGKPIQLMGIEYQDPRKFKSKVTVRAGKLMDPIDYSKDKLPYVIHAELAKLCKYYPSDTEQIPEFDIIEIYKPNGNGTKNGIGIDAIGANGQDKIKENDETKNRIKVVRHVHENITEVTDLAQQGRSLEDLASACMYTHNMGMLKKLASKDSAERDNAYYQLIYSSSLTAFANEIIRTDGSEMRQIRMMYRIAEQELLKVLGKPKVGKDNRIQKKMQ